MTMHFSEVQDRNDERKPSGDARCSHYQLRSQHSGLLCEAATKYEVKNKKTNDFTFLKCIFTE